MERCQYNTKQGICNSPAYANKTIRVMENNKWIKKSLIVCIDHAHPKRWTQRTYTKKCKPVGERSLYWEWINNYAEKDNNEGDDKIDTVSPLLNPDNLAETDLLWAHKPLGDELQDLVEITFKKAEKILTHRQKEIFDLLVFERRNVMEIAVRLGVSHQTISRQIKVIVDKFKDVAENETLGHTMGGL